VAADAVALAMIEVKAAPRDSPTAVVGAAGPFAVMNMLRCRLMRFERYLMLLGMLVG
jgi:hypothetical protein